MKKQIEEQINLPIETENKAKLQELKKFSKTIKDELGKVENSFLKVAYSLYKIHEQKLFEEIGYKNIYDLAKTEFSIARGTANNFINIIERFGLRNEQGVVTSALDNRYKDFKSSQLILMLGMDEKQLLELTSDMTVKQIKEKKSASKENSKDTEISVSENEVKEEQLELEMKEIKSNLIAEITDFKQIAEYKKVIEIILKGGRKIQIIEIVE